MTNETPEQSSDVKERKPVEQKQESEKKEVTPETNNSTKNTEQKTDSDKTAEKKEVAPETNSDTKKETSPSIPNSTEADKSKVTQNTGTQITVEQLNKMIELVNAGMTMDDIAKQMNLSKRTVQRKINRKRKEDPSIFTVAPTPEESEDNNDEDEEKPDTNEKPSDSKRKVMADDKKVQSDLFKAFENSAYKDLLPILKEEFKERFKAGATLIQYEMIYRESVEDMGVKWNEFMKFSFEIGYKIILNQYIEEEEKRKKEEEAMGTLQDNIKIQTVKQIVRSE